MVDLRIGVDVGGTHTDAVALDLDGRLVYKAKVATTSELSAGITAAITRLLAQGGNSERVTHVMLGSTHATNAIVERRNLRRVAVLRIGAPTTLGLPPFVGWPAELCDRVQAGQMIIEGGFRFDGEPITQFDAEAVARFCAEVAEGVDTFAISCVFAPVNNEHELAAREIVRRELGDVPVSISSEIGTLGLLERENATILNAALLAAGEDLITALRSALQAHDLDPVALFSQNDGTLMALEQALRYPVLTIGSGPANSLRGAAHLSGVRDALVADIGGTTTDVGVLVGGYPRQSMAPVEIGGVRTNFRMPDVISLGVGGGTVLSQRNGHVEVGPRSVGQRLTAESLVFGGEVSTLTDAAVAAGLAELGELPAHAERELLHHALELAHRRIEDALDRAKHARGDQTLIVVGGGSILIPPRLHGVSDVHRPEHFEVANAVGAAIGEVSGQIDRVIRVNGADRERILDDMRAEAAAQAIRAGARPGMTQIVELEEIPLAYLEDGACRIRVKATGPIQSI